MVARWVGHPPSSPAMAFGDRCDFGGSCRHGSCEDGVWVVNRKNHANGPTVDGLRTGGGVGLNPEVGSFDRELSDDHVTSFVLEAFQLGRTEGSPVGGERLRRVLH